MDDKGFIHMLTDEQFGASARSDCCASNGNYEERTDK